MLPILNENIGESHETYSAEIRPTYRVNTKGMSNETKHFCVWKPSIKVIAPIGKHLDECELLNVKIFRVAFKLRHRYPSRKRIYSLYW